MHPRAVLVLCTCPDRPVAEAIARRLVERRLVACVNLVAGVASVYRWQGAVEETTEVLMLLKTHEDRYAELESAVLALHPYELPELLVLPVSGGSAAYLAWLEAAVR